MPKTLEVHDLSDEQVKLVKEFIEFLRMKIKLQKDDQDWAQLAINSFQKDWDNEEDSIYDNWQELYHVQKR